MAKFLFTIPKAMLNDLQFIASQEDRSVAGLIRIALREWLARNRENYPYLIKEN